MNLKNYILIFFILTTHAFAYKAPEPKIKSTCSKSNCSIEVTIKNGYQFNLKAPNALEILNEKTIYPSSPAFLMKLSFKIKSESISQKNEGLKLIVYICDDQKTFCERQEHPIVLNQ
jgi:hypothetical protein